MFGDKHSKAPQFSKVIIFFSLVIAAAICTMTIFLEISETVSVALIGVWGAVLTTTIIFYLRKSQAENTIKIYMGSYKEILKLKKKYGEDCDELINQMENGMEDRIGNTLNSSLDEATTPIELEKPNIM